MDIHVHVHEHCDLSLILSRLELLMANFTELEAAVARNHDVDQSALTLIQGIAAKLEEAKNDPVKIQQLADDLNASSASLAAAVSANTPVEPPTEPPVEPPTA